MVRTFVSNSESKIRTLGLEDRTATMMQCCVNYERR